MLVLTGSIWPGDLNKQLARWQKKYEIILVMDSHLSKTIFLVSCLALILVFLHLSSYRCKLQSAPQNYVNSHLWKKDNQTIIFQTTGWGMMQVSRICCCAKPKICQMENPYQVIQTNIMEGVQHSCTRWFKPWAFLFSSRRSPTTIEKVTYITIPRKGHEELPAVSSKVWGISEDRSCWKAAPFLCKIYNYTRLKGLRRYDFINKIQQI